MSSLEITLLSFENARDLAVLHATTIPWSLTTKRGQGFLTKLYESLLSCKDYTAFGAYLRGELLGATSLSSNAQSTREITSKVFRGESTLRDSLSLLMPANLVIVLETLIINFILRNRLKINAEWSTLMVLEDSEQKSSACLLLTKAAFDFFRKRKHSVFYGQTYSQNREIHLNRHKYSKACGGERVVSLIRNDIHVYHLEKLTM
jgi:hypothetical protein